MQHTIIDFAHSGVVDSPCEAVGVILQSVLTDYCGDFNGIFTIDVEQNHRLDANGKLRIYHSDRCSHLNVAEMGCNCAVGVVATHLDGATVGTRSTHIVRASERDTLHIVVDKFAIFIVAQHTWSDGEIDGRSDFKVVEAERRNHIGFFIGSSGKQQHSIGNGTRSYLGGLVDNGSAHHHLCRASGIVVAHVPQFGNEELEELAAHRGATTRRFSIDRVSGHIYHKHI